MSFHFPKNVFQFQVGFLVNFPAAAPSAPRMSDFSRPGAFGAADVRFFPPQRLRHREWMAEVGPGGCQGLTPGLFPKDFFQNQLVTIFE